MKTSEYPDGNEKLYPKAKNLNRRIFKISIISIFFLALMSSVLLFLKYSFHVNSRILEGLISLFYMDKENNVPTYFSTVILLVASLLLLYIFLEKWLRKDRYKFHWGFLSGIFLLMSMDEFMSLHERIIEPFRDSFNLGGWLYFSWIIPGSVLVLGLGIFFLRFLLHLPYSARVMFIISGAVYIGGALGVESLGGYLTDNYGQRNFSFAMVANIEETLELLGIAYFIYALLLYIKNDLKQVIKIKILKPASGQSFRTTSQVKDRPALPNLKNKEESFRPKSKSRKG